MKEGLICKMFHIFGPVQRKTSLLKGLGFILKLPRDETNNGFRKFFRSAVSICEIFCIKSKIFPSVRTNFFI